MNTRSELPNIVQFVAADVETNGVGNHTAAREHALAESGDMRVTRAGAILQDESTVRAGRIALSAARGRYWHETRAEHYCLDCAR